MRSGGRQIFAFISLLFLFNPIIDYALPAFHWQSSFSPAFFIFLNLSRLFHGSQLHVWRRRHHGVSTGFGYTWKDFSFTPPGTECVNIYSFVKKGPICLPGAKIFASSTFASSGCTSIFPDWVCKSRLRPKYFLHTRFYTPRLQIALEDWT